MYGIVVTCPGAPHDPITPTTFTFEGKEVWDWLQYLRKDPRGDRAYNVALLVLSRWFDPTVTELQVAYPLPCPECGASEEQHQGSGRYNTCSGVNQLGDRDGAANFYTRPNGSRVDQDALDALAAVGVTPDHILVKVID